jgi:hypothetical protein
MKASIQQQLQALQSIQGLRAKARKNNTGNVNKPRSREDNPLYNKRINEVQTISNHGVTAKESWVTRYNRQTAELKAQSAA